MFAPLPAARRLAIATLSEAGDGAAAFRGPDGHPLHGYVLMTGEGSDCRITIFLERGGGAHTAVLAGEMVWFQSPNPEEPTAKEPAKGPTEEPAEVGFKLYPEPAVPVSAVVPHKIEVTVTPVPTPTEAQPAESATESTTEAVAETATEPATEPATEAVAQTAAEAVAETAAAEPGAPIQLSARHPLAPRAAGTARFDHATDRLVLNVRGLPSPATLNRSANAYRAWLLNQRTGGRHLLGQLTRLWGENFRLESDPELPLDRFDAVVVTAEDRALQGQPAAAPQVLLGTYTHP